MNTDTLMEHTPGRTPSVERLKDFCADLATRAQSEIDLTIELDAAAWSALRNDFQRPGKAKPERTFILREPWGRVEFVRKE